MYRNVLIALLAVLSIQVSLYAQACCTCASLASATVTCSCQAGDGMGGCGTNKPACSQSVAVSNCGPALGNCNQCVPAAALTCCNQTVATNAVDNNKKCGAANSVPAAPAAPRLARGAVHQDAPQACSVRKTPAAPVSAGSLVARSSEPNVTAGTTRNASD
jgi:hypothetical protein